MKYEIEYTVDAQNEDEAWMMVQEDTEGMTKRYLDEQTLSVEEVKEQPTTIEDGNRTITVWEDANGEMQIMTTLRKPKMRAEGFFIDEEDLEDLIGTWDDAEKALAEMDAVKKEEDND